MSKKYEVIRTSHPVGQHVILGDGRVITVSKASPATGHACRGCMFDKSITQCTAVEHGMGHVSCLGKIFVEVDYAY